jgi:hypothetical protein
MREVRVEDARFVVDGGHGENGEDMKSRLNWF